MPEERKSSVGQLQPATPTATENGVNSPSKSPHNKGKITLAKIILLDGNVKDFNIEVSFCYW